MENYFEDLSIPITDDESVIKKAYAAQLRLYHPEKSPEEFKRIRRAYEVLSSRTAREEHISFLQHGDRVQELMEEARQAYNAQKLALSQQLLLSVLEMAPDMQFPRVQLVRILLMRELYQDAISHLDLLIQKEPVNSLYYWLLADAYEGVNQPVQQEKALEKILEMEPGHVAAAIRLATLCFNDGARVSAARVLEACIAADGMLDIQDIPCLMRLVMFHVVDGKAEAADLAFHRILAVVNQDSNDRTYAARECLEICHAFWRDQQQDTARRLLKYALLLAPNDEEVLSFQESISPGRKERIEEERARLMEDEHMAEPFKKLAILLYERYSEEGNKEKRRIFEEEIDALLAHSPHVVATCIQVIKKDYSTLYEEYPDVYEAIWAQACTGIDQINSMRQAERSIEESGHSARRGSGRSRAVLFVALGILGILYVLSKVAAMQGG